MDTIYQLHPVLAGTIILVTIYLITLLLRWLIFQLVKKDTDSDEHFIIRSIQRRMKGTVFIFIPLMVLALVVGHFRLTEEQISTTRQVLKVLIIGSATIVVIRIINVVQDVLFHRYDTSSSDNLRARQARTQIIFLRKIAVLVITIIAAAIIMLSFDSVRKYGATILTSAGVAGIIIGFAAQKTIANLLAGFQIAFTQPIKIDDAVVVEGEWGWIEEINLTYVVIKIWDLRRLVVPITYFTEKSFQNWTRTSAQIIGTVYLYTDYTLPVDEIRKEFDRILNRTELWDKQIKNVQISDCDDHSMTVRFLMTAINSPMAWDLRCYVREELIRFVQEKYPKALPVTRAELHEKGTSP